MNKKALDHLIITLAAAIASLIFTTIQVTLIKSEQELVKTALVFLSACSDGLLLINLYLSIRFFFRSQTTVALIVAAVVSIVMTPLWFGFRAYVFEGAFEINRSINSLYVAYFNNVMDKVIDQTVTYFSVTLFAEEAVFEHLLLYVLSFLGDVISYILIPILPLILMVKEILRGNEVYRFSKEEEETEDA